MIFKEDGFAAPSQTQPLTPSIQRIGSVGQVDKVAVWRTEETYYAVSYL